MKSLGRTFWWICIVLLYLWKLFYCLFTKNGFAIWTLLYWPWVEWPWWTVYGCWCVIENFWCCMFGVTIILLSKFWFCWTFGGKDILICPFWMLIFFKELMLGDSLVIVCLRTCCCETKLEFFIFSVRLDCVLWTFY